MELVPLIFSPRLRESVLVVVIPCCGVLMEWVHSMLDAGWRTLILYASAGFNMYHTEDVYPEGHFYDLKWSLEGGRRPIEVGACYITMEDRRPVRKMTVKYYHSTRDEIKIHREIWSLDGRYLWKNGPQIRARHGVIKEIQIYEMGLLVESVQRKENRTGASYCWGGDPGPGIWPPQGPFTRHVCTKGDGTHHTFRSVNGSWSQEYTRFETTEYWSFHNEGIEWDGQFDVGLPLSTRSLLMSAGFHPTRSTERYLKALRLPIVIFEFLFLFPIVAIFRRCLGRS